MKAAAFDLGDTLVEYEGLPLSWEARYPEAIACLAAHLGTTPHNRQIRASCEVLKRHNTRLYPREIEIPFSTILAQLLQVLDFQGQAHELPCAAAFFRVFRAKLRPFPDTVTTLAALRQKNIPIGVFTDVPYGMPRELVIEDVNTAGIAGYIDSLATSRDVGFRKPAIDTLQSLAKLLSCELRELIYIGNEPKDIEVARLCGCRSVLVNRTTQSCDWGQDLTVSSLAELPALIGSGHPT